MEDWIRDETLARGYQPVYTPHIAKEDLWRISGHLENYAELMYPGMEVDDGAAAYRLKPMNCPFHILAYTSRTRSYRELPLRIAELGTVYRYERSGVVNGMLRPAGSPRTTRHIFCRRPGRRRGRGLRRVRPRPLPAFGLGEPSRVAVSTRPEKSIGHDEQWAFGRRAGADRGGRAHRAGLRDRRGRGRLLRPEDRHPRPDAIGREWQLTTVQVDFNLPERFDITYVGEDGAKHRPYMVHRALFGSIERFFAVMVESFNGAFPTWLAPGAGQRRAGRRRSSTATPTRSRRLRAEGCGSRSDASDDTLGNRIRAAQTSKIPYTLVVGGERGRGRTVAIRPYRGDQRKDVPLDDFVAEVVAEIAAKRRGDSRTAASERRRDRARRRSTSVRSAATPAATSRASGRGLQRLWAPWRFGYIAGRRPARGLPVLRAAGPGTRARPGVADPAPGRARLRHLQRLPLQPRPPDGRALRARADLEDAVDERWPRGVALGRGARRSGAQGARRAQGINLGMNLGAVAGGAGIADHLHLHACRAGVATPTSSPWSARPGCCRKALEELYDELAPGFAAT
jgi:hypothetical protein